MYNLNWTQAQEAMREGKRVKNSNFTGEEFFYMEDGRLLDEEGYPMAGWYRGYDWQDEGWMVIDDTINGRSPDKLVIICDDLSSLEDRIIARYDLETTDYFVGITPQSPTIPREKENYNFRITKGRGHNKFKKRKKK